MALAFMVSAEMVVAFVLYEEGYGGWVWDEMKSVAGLAWGGWMVMYAAMPMLLMGWESMMEKKKRVGHGFHRAGEGLHML